MAVSMAGLGMSVTGSVVAAVEERSPLRGVWQGSSSRQDSSAAELATSEAS